MTVPTVERMARVIIRKIASLSELKNSPRVSPNSLKLNGFASSAGFVMASMGFVALESIEVIQILQGARLHCQDFSLTSEDFPRYPQSQIRQGPDSNSPAIETPAGT